MSMHCPFLPSQQHMGLVMPLESGVFLQRYFGQVFKHPRLREKHHVAKCERICNVWNRYGRLRYTVLTYVGWRIIFL